MAQTRKYGRKRSTRRKFVSKKKVTTVTKVTKSRPRPRATGNLRKMIQDVVNGNLETKMSNRNTGNALSLVDSGINSISDMYQIVPNITKSQEENGRNANQITGQKLVVKGYIRFNTLNNTSNYMGQVAARLFIVSQKQRSNYTDVAASTFALTQLLRRGGTEVPFTGNISDIYSDLNTEVWTKHYDRVFYLSQDSMFTNEGAINTKNTIKFFRATVSCKKVLKYDDAVSGGLLPTNFAPILLLGYVYLSGAAPDVSPIVNLGLYYDSDLYYKDG